MENASLQPQKPPFNPSKRTIIGLNALLFCLSDVRHGVGPLLTIYLKGSLNLDTARIGLVLGLAEMSVFLTQVPAGLLADASRYKRTIVASACGLIIIACSLILQFPYLSSILTAQLIMGISIALISPAISSITLGLFGRKKLPSRAGINEIWNHAGNVFTALIAGSTAYFFGNQAIFYTVIMFALASMLSLGSICPKEIDYNIAREMPESPEKSPHKATPLPLVSLLKQKAILLFNISLIIYFLANGAQMALLGQKLTQNLPNYSPLIIALCMIVAELTMIAVAYIMSLIIDRYPRKRFLLMAYCFIILRAILFAVIENPILLILVQILDGMAAGILGVIGIVINSDLAVGTGRFNFLQGVAALSIGIGESLSQLLAGVNAKLYGFEMTFCAMAMIALFGVFFVEILMPETKNK